MSRKYSQFHVSPAGSLKLCIWYTAWFLPSHQNYMRSRKLKSEALHKLGGSTPSPVFSPCQPLCVDKTIYLYHFRAGQTGEGLGGTQGGGVREEVTVSLVVRRHWSAGCLLVSEVKEVPQEHFGDGLCQGKAVWSHAQMTAHWGKRVLASESFCNTLSNT